MNSNEFLLLLNEGCDDEITQTLDDFIKSIGEMEDPIEFSNTVNRVSEMKVNDIIELDFSETVKRIK